MTTKQINVQRFSVISSQSFKDVLAAIDAAVGHPEMSAIRNGISSAKTYADLEKAVHGFTGTSGLIEFMRFDLGEVVRKERGDGAPKSVRLLIGNPLIMKQMLVHVPDAGSYAPVTILIDERPDGVHLSYDTMASFLASYGNAEALNVARELDSKVEALLATAAAK